MSDREIRLQAALRAAVKAKNPWLAASIRAAMRGEEFDPFEGLDSGLLVSRLYRAF